jgi:pimeloyl-ACP methyl ester carboxylesterase
MRRRVPWWRAWLLVPALLLAAIAAACTQLPVIGARGLLHPARRRVATSRPPPCANVTFVGAGGVALEGWRCEPAGSRRGAIVYLHGSADNRGSAAGAIARFVPRGFEVIAYDSRAHGASGGTACTYGFFEKEDLRRVLDTIGPGPIVLIGASLGAAVALQEAADDRRVSAIVAAETFSDLRTVATERAPFFFTRRTIERAFALAQAEGHFDVDAVSPVAAAARITSPVLLIHGAKDRETPPDHSRRVYNALRGPKRLILVPGAPHNGSLRPEVWQEIETWVVGSVR